MSTAQMARRIRDFRTIGRGRLPDYRFCCNKVGRDGSAKANVEPAAGEVVWGVVYELNEATLGLLDGFEGGYQRSPLEVNLEGEPLLCQTYVSSQVSSDLLPLASYRDRMVLGAREHGLPAPVLDALKGLRPQD